MPPPITAHATHAVVVTARGWVFRPSEFGDQGIGREQQGRDARAILQPRLHDLAGRDARGHEVDNILLSAL